MAIKMIDDYILQDIAESIQAKDGLGKMTPGQMSERIDNINGGGDVPNPDDPLLLVDWDGTLLYSYTYEDAQQISEFPDPPTHEGLTFQSWNWSEVIAKTWLQNHRGGQIRVGAIYTPTDGQDHNYWRSPRLTASNKIYRHNRKNTQINNSAFSSCRSLVKISMPDGVTSISNNAFIYCSSLITINLPDVVTNIGAYAFYQCYSLDGISLPNSITSIGDYSFYQCYSLNAISLPDSVTNIGASAFQDCYSLHTIVLSDTLTIINSSTFSGCYALFKIDLPSRLTSIGNNAFQNCTSLVAVILSNSLATISGYAFANCPSLYKIDIPASVTLIGSYAFSGCTSLVDVIIRGTPALGGSVVFGNNPSNQRFYVHRSDLSWFSTATNWSAIYGEGKIVAAADYIEYLQSIGVDTSDFEGE